MTKKMLLIGLLLTLIITLNGCYSDDPKPNEKVSEVPISSFLESVETTADSEPTKETEPEQTDVSTQEETEYSKVIAETDTTTVSVTKEIPKSNDTEKDNKPEKVEKPIETTKPKEDTPSKSESKVEKEPEPEAKPEPPKETEVQEPETPKETFNVDYWIAYAKQYAINIGLELDVTAVDCWDNPIAANPKCTTIEENIRSRLNRYKNVEEFTAVWVWAEKVSDNGYEIYIGYA